MMISIVSSESPVSVNCCVITGRVVGLDFCAVDVFRLVVPEVLEGVCADPLIKAVLHTSAWPWGTKLGLASLVALLPRLLFVALLVVKTFLSH